MLEARASAAVLVFSVLWLAVAAGVAILAARRMRRAPRVIDAARRLRALVEAAPARPLLVHANGSIEMDRTLQRDLGLADPPTSFDELANDGRGLVADDLHGL